MARSTWFQALTRQQQEVFKLRQFAQYSRELRDYGPCDGPRDVGEDVVVVIEKREYGTDRVLSEHTYRVSPEGRVTDLGVELVEDDEPWDVE